MWSCWILRERLPLCHWEAKLPGGIAGWSWACEMAGLNVSRRPTDGQQSPNPGEEAGWCNKVQNSNSGQLLSWRNSAMEPVYMSLLNFTPKRGHLLFLCRCSAYWWLIPSHSYKYISEEKNIFRMTWKPSACVYLQHALKESTNIMRCI